MGDRLERDKRALDELFQLVYPELRRRARIYLQSERSAPTGQATALVHEAYLRLLDEAHPHWESRTYIFVAAAQAMRRILIEQARSRASLRHGGGWRRVPLTDDAGRCEPPSEELLAVDEALAHLQREDARMGRAVVLRYFAGLTVEETARVLRVSPRTVNRLWAAARAWLEVEISPGRSEPTAAP